MYLLNPEREREKHQCERNINRLPPVCAPTGDKTCSLGTCPDQGLIPVTSWSSRGVKLIFTGGPHQPGSCLQMAECNFGTV